MDFFLQGKFVDIFLKNASGIGCAVQFDENINSS